MKLNILTFSARQPAWVNDGFAEYAARLPRTWPLQLIELKPEARTEGKSAERLLATEAERLSPHIKNGVRIALDERGSAWSSRQLADKLGEWQLEFAEASFIIGSADGLAPSVKAQAHFRLQLSSFTLPHGLVRVMLAEQLYRSLAIIQGHPYHRD